MGLSKSPRVDELVVELQSLVTQVELTNTNLNDTGGVKELLVATKDFLDTISTIDYASETTLSAISGYVDGIETLLTSLDGKDYASETTLAGIKTKTDGLVFIGDRLKVDAEITISPEDGSAAAHFSITQNVASVQLVPANANRREVIFRNDPTGTKFLYINFRATATLSTPLRLFRNDVYSNDKYTGEISGIWGGAGTGTVEIIEVSKA